ncbi:MAG: hypothetical protein KGQ37_12900 [Hyphomicrobiales bacterium]|nr:hypothetical protein [Hyphomicrobiales bacterium]
MSNPSPKMQKPLLLRVAWSLPVITIAITTIIMLAPVNFHSKAVINDISRLVGFHFTILDSELNTLISKYPMIPYGATYLRKNFSNYELSFIIVIVLFVIMVVMILISIESLSSELQHVDTNYKKAFREHKWKMVLGFIFFTIGGPWMILDIPNQLDTSMFRMLYYYNNTVFFYLNIWFIVMYGFLYQLFLTYAFWLMFRKHKHSTNVSSGT